MASNRGRAVAGLFVAAVMVLPGVAQACCTNLLCAWCITIGSRCDGGCPPVAKCIGTWVPSCNGVGCNCNNTGPTCQCATPTRDELCRPVDCCDEASAKIALERFKEVDADGSGSVSMAEVKGWLEKKFGESWTQRVNKTDKAAAAGNDTRLLEIVFGRMDVNNDKSVSPGEFDNTLAEKK